MIFWRNKLAMAVFLIYCFSAISSALDNNDWHIVIRAKSEDQGFSEEYRMTPEQIRQFKSLSYGFKASESTDGSPSLLSLAVEKVANDGPAVTGEMIYSSRHIYLSRGQGDALNAWLRCSSEGRRGIVINESDDLGVHRLAEYQTIEDLIMEAVGIWMNNDRELQGVIHSGGHR
jgi:hypothetical protein